MKNRQEISFKDTSSALVGMMEGNPGSMDILATLMETYGKEGLVIKNLDDMNIRGIQIPIAHNMFCDNSYDKFIKYIINRSQDMVDFINSEAPEFDCKHKAVTKGATNNREFL